MKYSQLLVGMFVGVLISIGFVFTFLTGAVVKERNEITDKMYYNCLEVFIDKEKCAIAAYGLVEDDRNNN